MIFVFNKFAHLDGIDDFNVNRNVYLSLILLSLKKYHYDVLFEVTLYFRF